MHNANEKRWLIVLLSVLLTLCLVRAVLAGQAADGQGDNWWQDEALDSAATETLADPLEPLNRAIFVFNDKLYFWVFKPAATGYAKVVPEDVRVCIKNAFFNLLAPVRIVNNLLQGKLKGSGVELARFTINSTLGIAGLDDPARSGFGLAPRDEDLGQTLGVWGIGEGIYLCLPVLGPSTLRDTVGLAGDLFLDPLTYLVAADAKAGAGVWVGEKINRTSLVLGEYEQFVASAFDPYLAVRDAYRQYRRNKVKDIDGDKHGAIYSSNPGRPVGELAPAAARATGTATAGYFLQVAAAVDPARLRRSRQRLVAAGWQPQLRVYDRGDYHFYGLVVPAGATFATAKAEEQRLAAAGFQELLLVR